MAEGATAKPIGSRAFSGRHQVKKEKDMEAKGVRSSVERIYSSGSWKCKPGGKEKGPHLSGEAACKELDRPSQRPV